MAAVIVRLDVVEMCRFCQTGHLIKGDNDTAFAQHALLRTMRAMTTWFCDAYASWQKGGVENANGRLRRWLPRQIDIYKVSDEEIQDIVITANLTPRNAWASRLLFRQFSMSLAKTCKSGYKALLHWALESRAH
jgi:IS30 family transposase